jgi:predicted porin
MAAANYTVGNTTIYGGFTTTKTDGLTANKVLEDSKSQNIAVKYVMGNIDLMANYLTRKSNLTEAQVLSVTTGTVSNYTPTAKMIGLGANYNLSKNTSYYVRVEKISGLNGGSSTATLASQGIAPVVSYGNATSTKSMVGIRMAF